jgi:hypothetical protein
MILIAIVALLLAMVNGLSMRVQGSTLYAGRALAPPGSESLMPNGVQDAITPSWQTRLNMVWMLGVVALVVYGSFQRWYFGIIGFVIFMVGGTVAQAILPRALATYLRLIGNDLANREANFRKVGDGERADAAREFFDAIAALTMHAADTKQSAPSVREAQTTRFGLVEEL